MFQFSELPRPVIRHLSGLWRRRWTVIAVAWLAALLGWFAVWLLPDKYESRAHVYVQTETILDPVFSGIMARPDYSRRVQVMRLQLLTRPNVEEIILRAGLDKTIEARSQIERRAKMESLVEWLSGEIEIVSPRDMYFVISYSHSGPVIARNIVDAVLNLLIEQDLGASLAENEAARRRVNLRIEEFDERLTAKEREVADFRRDHYEELAISAGNIRQNEIKQTALVRVSDDLERTKQRIVTLQNLISATSRTSSGGELDNLKVQLAQLRSQYEEGHPDIRGVLARIEQLEIEAGGALSANPEYVRLQSELRVARNAIAGLEEREQRLQTELETLTFTIGQAPAAEAELQRIIRDYEQTQKTYGELLARRDRLSLTESLGPAGRGVEYQIFERPQEALTPNDPPRLLLIFSALVLAGAVGVGAVMLMTLIDKSYSQSSELKDAFGLPVLGVLSEVPSTAVLATRRKDYTFLGGAIAALLLLAISYAYLSVFKLPSEASHAANKPSSVHTRTEAA